MNLQSMLPRKAVFAAAALAGTMLAAPLALAQETVNIYSYRQPDLIKPVLDRAIRKGLNDLRL